MNPAGIIISQYRSSLEMLRSSIEACPAPLWIAEGSKNRFWHIAVHVIFYTHLYLSRSEDAFVPWSEWRTEYNFLGPLPWPPHREPRIGKPYEKEELLRYHQLVLGRVAGDVHDAPFEEPSGFPWLPFSRLELHLYNIRHVQHHAGQLIDRLRAHGGEEVAWVGFRHGSA